MMAENSKQHSAFRAWPAAPPPEARRMSDARPRRPRTPLQATADLDALLCATLAARPAAAMTERRGSFDSDMVGGSITEMWTSGASPSTSLELQPARSPTSAADVHWCSVSTVVSDASAPGTVRLKSARALESLPQVPRARRKSDTAAQWSGGDLRTRLPRPPPGCVADDLLRLDAALMAAPAPPLSARRAIHAYVSEPEPERGRRSSRLSQLRRIELPAAADRADDAAAKVPVKPTRPRPEAQKWVRRQSRRLVARNYGSPNEPAPTSEAKDEAVNKAVAEPREGKPRTQGHALGSGDGGAPAEQEQALAADRMLPVGRLRELSRESKLPYDLLTAAFEIFVELAAPSSSRAVRKGQVALSRAAGGPRTFDILTEGELTPKSFAKVLCMMAGVEKVEMLPEGMLSTSFSAADTDDTNNLDFLEFATWYARHGFSENLLLSGAQRRIREIARNHELPIAEVEEYKKAFDHFDEDGSGQIEYDEFVDLLNAMIGVPKHLELPASRVRQFWTETLSEKGGAVGFEDFLLFYTRYFSKVGPGRRDSQHSPLEEFYHAIRPVCVPRAW
mmetsp:Transcript_130639/g.377890  ORF Transcript_130639/g.377890 Transcript_130639/m.377890 type:complete len:564 (-) Transcript_130639:95-1786(-)